MIAIRRWAAAGIPFIYLLYLPIQSLLVPNPLNRPIELAALTIYLLVGTPTLLLFSGIRIPFWLALINLVASIILPSLVILQRDVSATDRIGGWVVMGTAVILTATAVRQHPRLAVIGLASLVFQIVFKYGPVALFSMGLVGAIVFVLAGLGVSGGIRRANLEAERYLEEQTKALAGVAAIEAAQEARANRLQEVLGSAIPALQQIRGMSDPLSDSQKDQINILELSLRDELRGKGLMTPQMKSAVTKLRQRGVEVSVLDEGGMDDLTEKEKDTLLAQVIEAIRDVSQGRITIRSPKGESFRLTVVATVSGQAAPMVNLRF
ncbi:MAG: hypothetical protein ACKOFA_02380 [Rhodoluna sp.]